MSEQEIDVCDPQPPAADGDEGTSVPLASGWDVSGHFHFVQTHDTFQCSAQASWQYI